MKVLALFVLLGIAETPAMGEKDCWKEMSGYAPNSSDRPAYSPTQVKELELSEPGCLGKCPVFRLIVTPTEVLFTGTKYVHKKGKHRSAIKKDEFNSLAIAAAAARLEAMHEDYCFVKCPDGSEHIVLDSDESAIRLKTDVSTVNVRECSGGAEAPRPYFNLKDKLRALAKNHGWL